MIYVIVMLRGGVWKNSEDEVLKAGVMKYGKMQWARVASLLARKSAKQCKARWYEWLDPSIKKTDWTQEEEEKLLHLAKLMPNQWRTIAPIVGRTASQCLEHYERLLDQAQAQASGVEAGLTSDARKLKPGEIDPAPEAKPARPDPVGMDEDEKEMLQEARARLANTRGKKAKRKAREKQLEEAQRLATLQKRRELKAAGLEMKRNTRKRRKYIDYGQEIPFAMQPPAGFYDVSEEREETKRQRLDPRFDTKYLHDLEEKRRDEEEERLKKKDANRLKSLMKTNIAQQINAVSKLNDPMDVRKRQPLRLPAPHVSDAELENIARIGRDGGLSAADLGAGSLAGDYDNSSMGNIAPTPMRTPSTTSGSDVVMQEARNMLANSSSKTPLLGGDNPHLEEGTGFAGSTPCSIRAETPSRLKLGTPGRSSGVADFTPVSSLSGGEGGGNMVGNTPMHTPIRDQLGLNQPRGDFPATPLSTREQRAREKLARSELSSSLQGLPEPQYTYEIVEPKLETEENEGGSNIPEDTAVIEARKAAEREAALQAEYARQSAAVRKELPRPPNIPLSLSEEAAGEVGPEGLIEAEKLALLARDSMKHPVRVPVKRKRKNKSKEGWETALMSSVDKLASYTDDELVNAHLLMEEEANETNGGIPNLDEFAVAWEKEHKNWAFFPSDKENKAGVFGAVNTASKADRLRSLRHQFQMFSTELERLRARCTKIEERIKVKDGGYAQRRSNLAGQLTAAQQALRDAIIELGSYQIIAKQELHAIPRRLEEARTAVRLEQEAEALLQQKVGKTNNGYNVICFPLFFLVSYPPFPSCVVVALLILKSMLSW